MRKAIGLDIGTAFIASARYDKNNIKALYVRDGFFKMDRVPQREHMLKESKMPYIVKDKHIYVIGNEAFDLALLFASELKRPLAAGVISSKEKESEFILKEIIRRVAGQGDPGSGDIAYFSVPADPIDQDFNIIYHREMFKRFLKEAGYNAKPLNEAVALAYAELKDYDFTGFAVSFGAGMVNAALVYKGLEIFSFSVARAGDWIDQQVASSRGIALSDAAAHKESDTLNLMPTPEEGYTNDVDEAIAIFYQAMLDYVVGHIVTATAEHQGKIKLNDALPFVVGGGTTMPKGFMRMLANTIKGNPLPIKVGKVWQPKNPVMAVCKGCLIAAQQELSSDDSDGVEDVSGGNNKKHQYPKQSREQIKKEEEKVTGPTEPRTPKEKQDDVQKANILSQGVGGVAEAIDLSLE